VTSTARASTGAIATRTSSTMARAATSGSARETIGPPLTLQLDCRGRHLVATEALTPASRLALGRRLWKDGRGAEARTSSNQ